MMLMQAEQLMRHSASRTSQAPRFHQLNYTGLCRICGEWMQVDGGLHRVARRHCPSMKRTHSVCYHRQLLESGPQWCTSSVQPGTVKSCDVVCMFVDWLYRLWVYDRERNLYWYVSWTGPTPKPLETSRNHILVCCFERFRLSCTFSFHPHTQRRTHTHRHPLVMFRTPRISLSRAGTA